MWRASANKNTFSSAPMEQAVNRGKNASLMTTEGWLGGWRGPGEAAQGAVVAWGVRDQRWVMVAAGKGEGGQTKGGGWSGRVLSQPLPVTGTGSVCWGASCSSGGALQGETGEVRKGQVRARRRVTRGSVTRARYQTQLRQACFPRCLLSGCAPGIK